MCGLRGCLTTFIGTGALLERARAAMADRGGADIDLEGFVNAALAGDRAALGVVDALGDHLGVAVAGLLNLMNPAVVVLGGGITALGDLLLDPLRQSMRQRALITSVARTRIVNSRLGKNAIAIGSTALVLDAALADLSLFPNHRRERVA
jgi:predicted NBD/HSP70 family sugar kinase